eukprot:3011950-Alexandrium_andersonii.AAC.1
MSASLVGSEMCIRDRRSTTSMPLPCIARPVRNCARTADIVSDAAGRVYNCLLYTSDAADDM